MQSSTITASYLARYQRPAEETRTPDSPGELLPVTGAQRRFLLTRRMDPAGRPALVPLFFAFPRGAVDLDRLRAAAGYLAALHPALRARPEVRRGVPVQRVGAARGWAHRVAVRPGERAAGALVRALGDWPVDGPPLRFFLASPETGPGSGPAPAPAPEVPDGGAESELLALVLDHAACDEQSLGRITEDLTRAYDHGLGPYDVPESEAAAELAGYREAVHLQLAAEERASGPDSLAYWARRLAVLRPPAPAAPRGAAPGTGAALHRLPLPADGGRAVAFPALLDGCAAAARTLYGAGHTPALGYPWGGRPAAAAPVLGCFLNTVVHPATECGPDERTTAWWDDLDRADAPFDEVVHAARGAGVPWSGHLDGVLTFEDLHRRPPLRLGGATGHETHVDDRPLQAPFAVSVSYGTDLLVRMVWQRTAVPDGLAEDAFAVLLTTLRTACARQTPVS